MSRTRDNMLKCCTHPFEQLSNVELIQLLREAASTWFNDRQLKLLEELIRRVKS
jgi:hypothetical protein